MRTWFKALSVGLGMGVISSLSIGLTLAQETPTPAPWGQATIDAAISDLLTQTAIAPTQLPSPTPTQTPVQAAPVLLELESQPDTRIAMEDDWLINNLNASPDSRWIAANGFYIGDDDNIEDFDRRVVFVFDLLTGDRTEYLFANTVRGLTQHVVQFSPDSRYLVMPIHDEGLTLIELETGRQRYLGDVPDWTTVGFSSDMRQMALGGDRGELRIVDLESGDETARWDIGATFVDRLVFVPRKNLLISLGSTGLEIWNTGNQERLYREADAHAFGLLPDGSSLIMLSSNETVAHLSLDTLEIIEEVEAPNNAGLLVGPSADGQSFAILAGIDEMFFYDLPSLTQVHEVESDGFVPDVSFSPNGRFAVQTNLAFILYGRSPEGTAPDWEEVDLRNLDAVVDSFTTIFMPDGRLMIYQLERGRLSLQVWSFTDMSAVTNEAAAETSAVPDAAPPAPAAGSFGGQANPAPTARP